MERRRRDKINNWIVQLSKIIPDCSMESTKSGQVRGGPWGVGAHPLCPVGTRGSQLFHSLRCLRGNEAPGVSCFWKASRCLRLQPSSCWLFLQSKGGILSKACDYIQELRQSNHRLSEELQGLDQLQLDNDVLRQQVSSTPWPLSPLGLCFVFHREAFSFSLH